MDHQQRAILIDCIEKLPTPHVTGAFLITGEQGYTKGEGVCRYFHSWCEKQWENQWVYWMSYPPNLLALYDWIRVGCNGLGTFMAAQLVADLKYLPTFRRAEDWWAFAAPGPGSKRGLNIVLGRALDSPWRDSDWLDELSNLNRQVTPKLEEIRIPQLHNQDLQNCLCEFSKYTKVSRGIGRPRQIFRPNKVQP